MLCFVYCPAECWSGFSAGVSFRRPRPQGCGRCIETAYMSSHVHVCGGYMCQLGASVLNSLSMCDESSGWEKSATVHGLTWPLTIWILKTLSICQGLGSHFAPSPISPSYLFVFVSPSLYLLLCLSLYLALLAPCLFCIDVQNAEMQWVCETDKKRKGESASPTHTSFILIRSLCPRKGLLFTRLP